MSSPRRTRPVLKAKKSNIAFLLAVAQAIYAGFNGNPTLYPSPPVPLATLLALIQNLAKLQQSARARVPGATAARDIARDALVDALESLRMYVQELCNASPEHATMLITTAGMKVAAVGVHAKPILAAKLGVGSGLVHLAANAGLLSKSKKKKVYEWGYTTDGGKTWISEPSTPDAQTSIAGLPPLTTCGFRVRVNDTVSKGEWSQAVSILVH